MKIIKTKCWQCIEQILLLGTPDAIIGVERIVSLTPRPVHRWVCPAGHENFVWLSHPFFEILWYKAIRGAAAEDTRGAVLDFFSAWDNFLAFWTEQMSCEEWEPEQPPPKELRRSERRLGLYAGMYFGAHHVWPPLVEKAQSVRNKVAHDNMIPTETEVLQVAAEVQQAIRAGLNESFWYEDYRCGETAKRRFEDERKAISNPHVLACTPLFLNRSFFDWEVAEAIRNPSMIDFGNPVPSGSATQP